MPAETAALFAASDNPEIGNDIPLDYLLDSDEEEKAKTLFTTIKKTHPDSELIGYYESELL
ncbi:MAG: hypothetical protein ACN4GF_01055 [Lentimonas sp.]